MTKEIIGLHVLFENQKMLKIKFIHFCRDFNSYNIKKSKIIKTDCAINTKKSCMRLRYVKKLVI